MREPIREEDFSAVWRTHKPACAKYVIYSVKEPAKKRRGHQPKKCDNSAKGYHSAIACHLAANRDCSVNYNEFDLKVLSRLNFVLYII